LRSGCGSGGTVTPKERSALNHAEVTRLSDPCGAVPVEHIRPVSQAQHEVAAVRRDSNAQHSVVRAIGTVVRRIEHGLERRLGQSKLASEFFDRKIPVFQQF